MVIHFAAQCQGDKLPSESRVTTSQFGKYQLQRKLAEGGMAEVFLAKQTGMEGFEKLVVVKLVHDNLATQKAMGQNIVSGQALFAPAVPPLLCAPAFCEDFRSTSWTSWSLRRRTSAVATPGWLGAQPVTDTVGPVAVVVPVGGGAPFAPAAPEENCVRYVLCGSTSAISRMSRS